MLTDRFKEKPCSVANYIDSPKENGYQSFHVKLLTDSGSWEEVHISSERMVRKSQFGCLSERNDGNIANWIEKFKNLLKDIHTPGSEATILIGPEGDFSPEEVKMAIEAGYKPVSLGNSRLRTETAALAACHILMLKNEK